MPALVAEAFGPAEQSDLVKCYSTHHLFLLHVGSRLPLEVPGTTGATTPLWSADGRSLLYASHNSIWLLPRTGSRPVKVAAPLLVPSDWDGRYGEVVDWSVDFAWSDAEPASQNPFYG